MIILINNHVIRRLHLFNSGMNLFILPAMC